MYLQVIFLVALSFLGSEGKINQYCSICQDHTMCQFEEGPGKACENAGEGGISQEHKTLIVDTHNWYRKIIAQGHEARGLNGARQPKAANLRKMVWDDELAKVAQRWADQCTFQHDTCRHDSRWRVGQNIYWNWRFPIINTVNWTAAIASWYDEVEKFDPKIVDSYKFDAETGHYTQMLWHDTNKIGCGRRNYGPNKIYVCNYGPAGNWLNDPMYLRGEPCSKCPAGTVCSEGLCEEKSTRAATQKKATPRPFVVASQPTPSDDSSALEFLTPPKENAENVYDKQPFKLSPIISLAIPESITKTTEEQPTTSAENRFNLFDDAENSSSSKSSEEAVTTEIPFDYNSIMQDNLDWAIEDDEEIKAELLVLQGKLRKLAHKLLEKQAQRRH